MCLATGAIEGLSLEMRAGLQESARLVSHPGISNSWRL